MKKQQQIQQGDVVLRRVSPELFKGGTEVPRRNGRLILADGEATGHCHAIESDDAELIQIGERMLLKLNSPARVKHEEHKTVTLPAGVWEVGRVQEYDYLQQMARPVAD